MREPARPEGNVPPFSAPLPAVFADKPTPKLLEAVETFHVQLKKVAALEAPSAPTILTDNIQRLRLS